MNTDRFNAVEYRTAPCPNCLAEFGSWTERDKHVRACKRTSRPDALPLVHPREEAPGPLPLRERAFDIYMELGPRRSLRKVALQLGVHVTSVHRWSSRYRWRERLVAAS